MKLDGRSSFDFDSVASQRPLETGQVAHTLHDATLMLTVVLALSVVLFGFVLLFRRRLRGRRRYHSPSEPGPNPRLGHPALEVTRRRRRRRSHRMNPSRAQIGGLPPKREDSPVGPANT